MNNLPLISIITVVYNCVDTIEATFQSVLRLGYKNIEYIVIDGQSTDGTVDIIKKYDDIITYWVSEPDRGIYDAMNKGIAKSTGDWVLNLNDGDTIENIPSDTLYRLMEMNYDACCASVMLDNGQIIKPEFNWKLRIRNTLPHQGMFYRNGSIYAHYDTHYKVFADYVYNIGMYKRKQKIFLLDSVVAIHSTNGASLNIASAKEFYTIVLKEWGFFYQIVSYVYFKIQGLKLRLLNLFQYLNRND